MGGFVRVRNVYKRGMDSRGQVRFCYSGGNGVAVAGPPAEEIENRVSARLFTSVMRRGKGACISCCASFDGIGGTLGSVFFVLSVIVGVVLLVFTFLDSSGV